MKKAAMIAMTGLLIIGLLAGCTSEQTKESTDFSSEDTVESTKDQNWFSDLNTTDIDGNPVTSEIFADKELTLINVWATFCGPCINELPVLEELSQEYNGKVGIVGLLLDTSSSRLTAGLSDSEKELGKQLLSDAGATYPQIIMSEEMLKTGLANINTFPTSYFVDKDGNFVGTSILGANIKSSWKQQIDKHLKLVKE